MKILKIIQIKLLRNLILIFVSSVDGNQIAKKITKSILQFRIHSSVLSVIKVLQLNLSLKIIQKIME